MQPHTKIWGYWLDVTEDTIMYELLLSKDKVAIECINIIPQENDSNKYLFFRKTLLLRNKHTFKLPESFHYSIMASLKKKRFFITTVSCNYNLSISEQVYHLE